MFDDIKLVEIGQILKPYGTDGQVKIKTEKQILDNILKDNLPVFMLLNELPVPFFIEKSNYHGNNILIKLSFIDNLKQAEEIESQKIYLQENCIKNTISKTTGNSIIGYKVFTPKFGELGVVENINYIPGNPVIEILKEQTTIIIPYIEEFIQEINHKEKIIKINPPEGLIELYL